MTDLPAVPPAPDSPGERPGLPPEVTPEFVFREYAPRIYHIARRMLGNDADAEDVTQDVLLQVIRKLDTFRGDSQLSTWLHRVTVNAALAHRQKRATRQKRETTETDPDLLEAAAPSGPVKRWNVAPDDSLLEAEQTEVIEKAIGTLPDPFRDVYVLADVEGLPNNEIADMLGLSLPAVKSRLHRARLRMRDALAPHFAEGGIAP
jgi:RNA polymerase sigma-70 factor (ECF subfamily)